MEGWKGGGMEGQETPPTLRFSNLRGTVASLNGRLLKRRRHGALKGGPSTLPSPHPSILHYAASTGWRPMERYEKPCSAMRSGW